MVRVPRVAVVLGTPGGRRVRAAVAALEAAGFRTSIVDWRAVLDRTAQLDGEGWLKIEPPEAPDDEPVLRHLVARGRGTDPAHEPPIAPGELRSPGALASGWSSVLGTIDDQLGGRRPVVSPTAIGRMFDKHETARLLAEAGVPSVPTSLVRAGDERALRDGRAFVKLRWGSGGHGIAVTGRGQLRASFAWRRFADGRDGWGHVRGLPAAPDAALAFLAAEGAVAQPVVGPLVVDGWVTDLRVVVLNGEPAALVWRQSQGPVTNLEQGGRRGDPARCASAVPARALADARVHALQAVAALGSRSGGVDLVFDHDRFVVLEVNPFGDLFPGVVDEAGRSLPDGLAARIAARTP